MTKSLTKTLTFIIYYIGYIAIKKIDDYESIYSVNPVYLRIIMQVYILKKKNGNKYLIFDSVDENKEVLKKYANVWNGNKNKIKTINGDDGDYGEDYMKIKSNSDDDLPLNKLLKFDGKLYPQLFLDDTLYELV